MFARILARGAIVAIFCLASAFPLVAQEKQPSGQEPAGIYETEKQRALELLRANRTAEALPVLEKLALARPNDGETQFFFGFAKLLNARTIADPATRQRERAQARAALLKAKQLGVDNPLLDQLIATIPPDGSEPVVKFSDNKEADAAMHEGETAFAKGDIDAALAAYERAFKLDPKLYEAALFAGDMHYRKKEWDKAADWFARAIAIDPDRETAYRYWGDALLLQNRLDEARDKFIEAIVAQPYTRMTWAALITWADKAKVELGHPRIEPVNSGEVAKYWKAYADTRQTWAQGQFIKEFPNEKAYRHSLREEAAALRATAEAVLKDPAGVKLASADPSLANLLELHRAGLLEPYVLLARADEGIAQDYAAYRRANREKLRRYIREQVIRLSK